MSNLLEAFFDDTRIDADDLDHEVWRETSPVHLHRYWSGEDAPVERHAEVRIVWSHAALLVRFDCRQEEPLIVSRQPQRAKKTVDLWERDVCEVFIAPNANEPERYFEFEAAPTGEWLDLAIRQTKDGRETDWDYSSGMSVATRSGGGRVTIVMRLPWEAFECVPHADERWRVNLFRCVGSGEMRGYLAWQPTHTSLPNFHVPEAFGWLCFVN
jgi:cellulose/xylan binding protein with CBM9 domain